MNENVKAMWADPRFKLLADLTRLLDSSKWCGMELVYHPMHSVQYHPMADRLHAELCNLYTEYGVKNEPTGN